MQPLRVLCLFTILNRGGAETMCMNVYRKIDRSKVQFDFLVYHEEKGAFDDEIQELGGHIYRIPNIKNIKAHIKGARDFFSTHSDYSIVHNHMQSSGGLICREAKKAGVNTIIYHSHFAHVGIWEGGAKKALPRLRNAMVNEIALRSSTDFFACGEASAEAVPKRFRPIQIVRNAIDLDAFRFNNDVRQLVRKRENCQSKLIIGNVARFDDNKNQSFAVDVFKAVVQNNPKAELWFVGDGYKINEVKAKVRTLGLEDCVRFWGIRSDISELLQAMDVFLFPSLAEGLPVSCIEAQATGLACVFSDGFDRNTVLTDKCTVLSLSRKTDEWAKRVLAYCNYKRIDSSEIVRKAGYDINITSQFIQDYYLSKAVKKK